VKHFGTLFWSSVLGVSILALAGGFFSGRSLQSAGAMPGAMRVPSMAPAPLARSLSGARGAEAPLEDVEAPVEDAVVARPRGWAPARPPGGRGAARLAIVIAGIGIDDTLDRRFAQIPYPLTFAIPSGGDLPAILSAAGSRPRSVLVDADGARSVDAILARLEQVHAEGVLTPLSGHPSGAKALAERLGALHAYVVDGMAGGSDAFYRAARARHVGAVSRDIVLDAYDEQSYVGYMLRQAAELARRTGVAIAVARANPETFDALRADLQAALARDDVEVVPVGDLVR
jgi:polysaccharide deacetylase 2 family uncharacterized protein YibQ